MLRERGRRLSPGAMQSLSGTLTPKLFLRFAFSTDCGSEGFTGLLHRQDTVVARPALSGALVTMLVTNDVTHDTRVLKEAVALSDAGAEVRVLGVGLDSPRAADQGVRIELVAPMKPSEHPVRPVRICMNLLREAVFRRRFVSAAVAEPADVVHSHDLDTLSTGRRAARSLRARLVYDAHELFTEQTPGTDWRRRRLRRFERRMLKRVDLSLCASDERADVMHVEYGAPKRPLVIRNVPPGRESCPEPPDEARRLRSAIGAERLVIYQGGIAVGRGLEKLASAVERLPEGIHLIFQGPFSDAGLVAQLNQTSPRVHVLGPVPPDDVIPWASIADAGVVTYQPDCRNNLLCAPNKMYDYAAACIPIVGADLPPVRSEVEKWGAGVVFTPGDVASFASAVTRLFEDDAAYQRMKQAARQMHLADTWESEAAKLVDAYAGLLG